MLVTIIKNISYEVRYSPNFVEICYFFPYFGRLTNTNCNVISKAYRFSSRHERSFKIR